MISTSSDNLTAACSLLCDLTKRSDATGDYDGVVHAVGMLFAGSLNRFASGSGSVPDPGTTYDKITRQTAFAATAALGRLAQGGAQVYRILRSIGRMRYRTVPLGSIDFQKLDVTVFTYGVEGVSVGTVSKSVIYRRESPTIMPRISRNHRDQFSHTDVGTASLLLLSN